jgi:FMN phosphatase YigB (HAD superfamily)
MIKRIIFDIDGVLIKADGDVRTQKYKKLFDIALGWTKDDEYNGTTWMFDRMKGLYDKGFSMDNWKLLDKNIPDILEKLSKKYVLYACSVAKQEITKEKLKKTGILKYFADIFNVPPVMDDTAIVDDRPKDYPDFYYIRFQNGKYAGNKSNHNKKIKNLKQLCEL